MIIFQTFQGLENFLIFSKLFQDLYEPCLKWPPALDRWQRK